MTAPRIRALLVDFDGTLADTAVPNAQAYARALAEQGIVADLRDLQARAHGRSWRDFLPHWLPDPEQAQAVALRKRAIYGEMIAQAPLNRPLCDLLIRAKPGRAVALVTTAARVTTERYIALTPALAGVFDLVVTGDDVARAKPDPEAYALAGTRLGCAPREALAFEDSAIGLAAARAYGARVRRVVFPCATGGA
jgi:beta-phosphoglucomutase